MWYPCSRGGKGDSINVGLSLSGVEWTQSEQLPSGPESSAFALSSLEQLVSLVLN